MYFVQWGMVLDKLKAQGNRGGIQHYGNEYGCDAQSSSIELE